MADILPDILSPGLKIVFCGTAAGSVSAQKGAYYAGPGNKFWPTLARIGLTPRLLRPEEFATVPVHGIGLTDIVKRAFGADASLPPAARDAVGLAGRIRGCHPAFLAFNGKTAARWFLGRANAPIPYGLIDGPDNFPRMIVLPSTSGAANGAWDEGPWRDLARLVGSKGC